MTTHAHWDEELESLVNTVTAQLGDAVFTAAIGRAFTRAQQHQVPLTLDAISCGGLITDGHQAFSLGAFYDALRTELRRVVRPQ